MLQVFSLQLLLLATSLGLLPATFSSRSQGLQTSHEDEWNPKQANMDDIKLLYDLTRPSRHADGLFTSGYSKLLGQLTAKDYLESLIAKRVNGDSIETDIPAKRHSDALFTDQYSRFRQQMAVKKYLDSLLTGKRSVDNPTLKQTGSDVSLDELVDELTQAL